MDHGIKNCVWRRKPYILYRILNLNLSGRALYAYTFHVDVADYTVPQF